MSTQHPIPRPAASIHRAQTPTYDVRDLVGVDGTADILLDDQVYRLRITRAGKLILTK
jgi:hemin uptake protein HemP